LPLQGCVAAAAGLAALQGVLGPPRSRHTFAGVAGLLSGSLLVCAPLRVLAEAAASWRGGDPVGCASVACSVSLLVRGDAPAHAYLVWAMLFWLGLRRTRQQVEQLSLTAAHQRRGPGLRSPRLPEAAETAFERKVSEDSWLPMSEASVATSAGGASAMRLGDEAISCSDAEPRSPLTPAWRSGKTSSKSRLPTIAEHALTAAGGHAPEGALREPLLGRIQPGGA